MYTLIQSHKHLAKDYPLRDQIQRSVISVPSNIAEGFERQSKQEFMRFLYIARGSCGELRTQLYICLKLDYIREEDYLIIEDKCKKISSMLANLARKLQK